MNRFEDIYKENYKTMFCLAKKMINDDDVVNDIVQEVFVYYFEKLKTGHDVNHPKSWLVRATMNKCINYSNRQKKFRDIDSVNENKTADDSYELKETKAIIKSALSRLKPQERLLAILYSEGFSYKEMSELAEIKFSSVGKLLSRTLNKLKEIFKNENYDLYQ